MAPLGVAFRTSAVDVIGHWAAPRTRERQYPASLKCKQAISRLLLLLLRSFVHLTMVSITQASGGGHGVAKTYQQLPATAPVAWGKPLRPEGYTPSTPGVHVAFSGSSAGEEAFSSKLLADKVGAVEHADTRTLDPESTSPRWITSALPKPRRTRPCSSGRVRTTTSS